VTRTHPPTLIKLALRTLKEECRIERGESVLVAVSGGGDSSALLHVMSIVAPRLGLDSAHGIVLVSASTITELSGGRAPARCPFPSVAVIGSPG
jgi:tRNA(Ile)-lysidine synthase